MLVPKTSVDEDYSTMPQQHYVGPTGKIRAIDTKP
jgi:hypothetical protein